MNGCENCGTRISDGICPNCEEESYIMRNQYHEDPFPLSDEFIAKVDSQRQAIEDRRAP